MSFNRGLCDEFINLLHAEAKKSGWWRDVLDDKTLLIGGREEYLNVYWQGQALFTVERVANTLRVTTHEKFLMDPDLSAQVRLEDGKFNIESLRAKGFMSQFEAGKTLPKMKRTAQRFAGNEKKGCHVIAERNAMVVDFEVALPIDANSADKLGRIDFACFVEQDEAIRLTFWEAKHFASPELRAQHGDAPVVHQVERYTAWITAHRTELEESYRQVARNLTEFKTMGWKRALPQSVEDVARGRKPLLLDDCGPVTLVVFGFDQDQRDGKVWGEHRKKLAARIKRMVSIGNAKNLHLPSRTIDSPVENPLSEVDPVPDLGNEEII